MLGAFGAHALQARFDVKQTKMWETAAHYQAVHAGAAMLAAYVGASRAASFLVGGTALFSGSLYLLALTGVKKLGMLTPIGGLGLAAGWLLLGLHSPSK